LWSANRDQLIAAGLRPANIHLCRLSTAAYPGIFDSYRIAGERAGRMAALIAVPQLSGA
jgi:copper oxidase (laccase) domain-containing protein